MATSAGIHRTWALVVGATILASQLILVWCFEYFPSVDGPAHVHLAHALYEAWNGDSFYRELVELNSKINPNMATQATMVALMAIAPPFIAEKIWLSLYFAAFICGGWYALSGIHRDSLCLLPLLSFCGITFALAFGFYNFSLSVVVFLVWFGYWWRHREQATVGIAMGHAIFALVAYFTHIFAFIISLFGIGLAACAAVTVQYHYNLRHPGARPPQWFRPIASHALIPLLASAPALAACLYFLFGRFGQKTVAGATNVSVGGPDRISELLSATSLAPYDSMESVTALAFLVTTLFVMLYLLRRSASLAYSIPFAACLAGFLALYLIMPSQWIVRWMPARFQPMVFVALILWLASLIPSRLNRSIWKAITVTGLITVLLSGAIRFEVFKRIDSYYLELASLAPLIDEHSTLIGLRLHPSYQNRPFPAKLDVFVQSGSRIASLRNSVDLKNFQGHSGDHPIQFSPGVSATVALGGDRALVSYPPRIRLMNYEALTGRPIDYVLLYGSRIEVDNISALARLDQQLAGNYRLIGTSKPVGFVQLYARDNSSKDPVPAR